MADELQALLDKITDQELQKTEAEKAKILSQAKEEADATVQKAKEEAKSIVENAKREAAILQQKGEEALRQSSRDVLLSLRSELEKRVKQAAESLLNANMKPTTIADIVSKLIVNFVKADGSSDNIQILLNPDDVAMVEEALKASLADNLRANCALAPSHAVNGGFKLLFKDAGVMYDFTDKALAETVAAGLGGKLASVITD